MPLYQHGFAFHGLGYSGSARVWKQTILLRYGQKVSSLMLCHGAYVTDLTSSHHVVILSFHMITRSRVSTVQ